MSAAPHASAADADAGVVVRPATRADLPRLGRLGALLVETHHELDARRFLPTRDRMPADYAAFLVSQMHDPHVVLLVADDHDDVIGYAYGVVEGHDYMALRGPAGVLHDLVVERASRGRGVGRRLLDAALAALEARGAPRVVLSTAAGNAPARRLYERAGFRPTLLEMTRETTREIGDRARESHPA
jgi:ribosomal protein S18 acetylase RimI-like enzyme